MQKYFIFFILFVLSTSLKSQSGGIDCREFGPWLCDLDPIVIIGKPKSTPPISMAYSTY